MRSGRRRYQAARCAATMKRPPTQAHRQVTVNQTAATATHSGNDQPPPNRPSHRHTDATRRELMSPPLNCTPTWGPIASRVDSSAHRCSDLVPQVRSLPAVVWIGSDASGHRPQRPAAAWMASTARHRRREPAPAAAGSQHYHRTDHRCRLPADTGGTVGRAQVTDGRLHRRGRDDVAAQPDKVRLGGSDLPTAVRLPAS